MTKQLNQLIKKTITVCAAAMLFTSVAHSTDAATKIKKAPASMIDMRYNDSRNQTADLGMSQGYRIGETTWYGGEIISAPVLNTRGSFVAIAKEKDKVAYAKAKNPSKVNYVRLRQANGPIYNMPVKINTFTQYALNTTLIDHNKLNKEFLVLLNKERISKGLKPLKYAAKLQSGADIRAKELSNYGDIRVDGIPHKRPDGTMFETAFRNVKTSVIGENVALFSYDGNPYKVVSEKFLAEKLFTQWKNSPSHYTNMMLPKYNYSSVSVYVGEVVPDASFVNGIYGTQALCK